MSKWVSVWGNAMSIVDQTPAGYAKDITLRYPILIPLDGKGLRLTFDNFTGLETIKITKITVAKSTGPSSIDLTTLEKVTFNGMDELELGKGEHKTCDPIVMNINKGECLTVSLYLKDYTSMRCGIQLFGPTSKSYYSLGNQTISEELCSKDTREITWMYFLSQIDLLTSDENKSVICFGDSITSLAWPDYLQLFFMKDMKNNTSIVRKAVSGSRILRQYDCLTYAAYGIQGLTRFPHETKVKGAESIIILHGINDIIHPVGIEINEFRPWSDLPTVQELIDGLCEYIKHAKSLGLKVYLGTLTPIKGWRTYNEMRNTLREEINTWIRSTDLVDGMIDFDLILRDENDPAELNPIYDSGDHLHPNDLGMIQMAQEAKKVLNND